MFPSTAIAIHLGILIPCVVFVDGSRVSAKKASKSVGIIAAESPAVRAGECIYLTGWSRPSRARKRLLKGIFTKYKINCREIDASLQENHALRSNLWELTGRHANYPQVFIKDGHGEKPYTSLGGFNEFRDANEVSTMVKRQPELLTANDALKYLMFETKFAVLMKDQDAKITAMTWNLLARPYTKYNYEHHRAGKKQAETPEQTRERYALSGEEIVRRGTDLVFLQECEARFFEVEWNSAAKKVNAEYDVFACRKGDNPGTSVLLKKTGQAAATVQEPICVGGTNDEGGSSKIATVVPVDVGSKEMSVVSTHFTWNGAADKRQHHANLLAGSLASEPQNVVLGGDFNCEPGEHLAELEENSFLGRMQHAQLADGNMTALSGDFSHEENIDHMYLSHGITIISTSALWNPRNPYKSSQAKRNDGTEVPATVVGPSDHVPVLIEFSLH